MATKKRSLKKNIWSDAEIKELKEFFKQLRSNEEKKEFSKKLNRTWEGVYNKYWNLKQAEKKPSADIKVTHITKPESPKRETTIVVGDAVIKMMSPRFKVNSVLIEV